MIELLHINPDDTSTKIYVRAFGVDYTCDFQSEIFQRDDIVFCRFEGVPENVFNIVSPITDITYQGEEITENELISLLESTVISAPNIPIETDWTRPEEWPTIPLTSNFAYIVWAVFEDEPVNGIQLTMNNNVIIDWGDGTTSGAGAGLTRTKSYNYSTIDSEVYESFDGRNYKPVLITINRNAVANITQFAINDGSNLPNNALEIVDRIENSGGTKNYRLSPIPLLSEGIGISAPSKASYLESINLRSNLTQSNSGFFGANRVKNLVVNSGFFTINGSAAISYWARGSFCNNTLPNVVFNSTSPAFSLFSYARIKTIGNISGSSNMNISSMFQLSTVEEIGDFTFPNNTGSNTTFIFDGTFCLQKIGLINLNAATDLSSLFQSSGVREVEFVSCANVSITSNMFNNTGSIQKLIMPGLRFGLNVSNNRLQAAAINAFFTALGTSSGSQTINVSGNPGAATCNTSLATTKGFTVITA
jgi:hypothetical protein